MLEERPPEQAVQVGNDGTAGKWILLAVALLYIAGSSYFLYSLNSRLEKLSKDLNASDGQIAELSKRVQNTEADDETLAKQVGLTKRELAERAADLPRQQRAAEARINQQQKEQITQVSGEVAADFRGAPACAGFARAAAWWLSFWKLARRCGISRALLCGESDV